MNVALAVILLGVGVVGVVLLLSPGKSETAGLTTTKVVRGELEATVTASGNIVSGRTASLQPSGSGGTVEEVFVMVGQKVSEGDQLLRVDDTSARSQLDSALVQLDSAHAGLLTATQGRTGVEKAADAAGIASAQQTLRNAENALASAKSSLALVKKQQAEIVGAAQSANDDAAAAVAAVEKQIADLKAQLAATDPADTQAVTDLQNQIDQANAQLVTDKAALAGAQSTLAAAKRARDTAVSQAQQGVTSQQGSRDSASKALAQQRANVKVNQQGPKDGTVKSAEAQVASAQLAVDQARTALDETVMRAPFAGVIAAIDAVVGQSSAAGPAASGGGTSGGSSGLVTLVDPDGMTVSAAIAEADATSVKAGQPVRITLPASGVEMTGKVISVDVQSTVSNNVVQYTTTVSLDSPPAGVRVGQTAGLTVVTGTLENVLHVPTSAIGKDGATTYVTKISGDRLERVDVTTGLVGTTGTEILSGLSEGDEILLSSSTETTSTGGVFPGSPSATATP